MRVLVQRVSRASVKVAKDYEEKIDKGFLLLVGFEEEDDEHDLEWMARKVLRMRLFSDQEGKMNLDIKSVNGKLLIISQFTLHASVKKGNRPSFIKACNPKKAERLYNQFNSIMAGSIDVRTGLFGAHMKVELLNDGPVTIWVDSKNKE